MLERRRIAAQVLDSPELLMMAAQRDNEVYFSLFFFFTCVVSSPFFSTLQTPSPTFLLLLRTHP